MITISTSSEPSSENSTPRSPIGSAGAISRWPDSSFSVLRSPFSVFRSGGRERRTENGERRTETLMRLANKVVLITGGGSGIGKASCLLFAKEGAKVVVVDLKKDTAEATAREIGGNARAFGADISKAKDAEAMVAFAEKSFGRLDVVLSNAGVFHPDDHSVTNTTEDIWDLVIDINLKGVYLGCKYAIPALQRAGG